MRSLYRFLTGYRTLRIVASSAGEVMNLCRSRGFVYWNLRFCGEHICLDASPLTAKKLLCACREHGISAVAENARGLPSLLWRYRHRWGLAVGAVCFAAIIFASSRVLWGIRVDGNSTVSDEEVLAELRASGLSLGCSLSELDTEVVENLVLIHSDEISWISVNLIGTVAHVELREVEEIVPEEPTYDAANLVASRGGTIEMLEDVRGNVMVKPGDVVSEGELLVGGLYDTAYGGLRYRCAGGKVYARTEYDFLVEIPKKTEQKRYTGRKKVEKSLIFFEKEIKFFGNSRNLPPTCDTIEMVEYLSLSDDAVLPFGIRTVSYREYELVETERSESEMLDAAYDALYEQMESEVPDGSLVRKRVTTEITDAAVVLRCRAEYLENIAILREIEIAD